MTYNPMSAAGRVHRLRQRFGPEARCLTCGIADPTQLLQPSRQFFEAHHVLGAAHAPELTVCLCRNCHAQFSAGQSDDDVLLTPQPTLLERLVAIFEALVSFIRVLAELLDQWIERARGVVAGLDTTYPTWRTAPWAA